MKMRFLHKRKKAKTCIGRLLQLIIYNHMTRILFCGILFILGAFMSSINLIGIVDIIAAVLWYIGAGGLALHAIIFLLYALIINPIRSIKK